MLPDESGVWKTPGASPRRDDGAAGFGGGHAPRFQQLDTWNPGFEPEDGIESPTTSGPRRAAAAGAANGVTATTVEQPSGSERRRPGERTEEAAAGGQAALGAAAKDPLELLRKRTQARLALRMREGSAAADQVNKGGEKEPCEGGKMPIQSLD